MITFKEHFIVTENTAAPAGDLSEPIEVGPIGLGYLQSEIEKVNKKAIKWGVAPLILHIVSTREIPKFIGDPWGARIQSGTTKLSTVTIQGKAPQVQGYTFVAKVEHISTEGNILNFAPDSPIKNLPEVYRTIGGGCDVCGRAKERINTYILRIDIKDPKYFPNKNVGDLIQAGSICLKRFLPGISIEKLTRFAEMIEMIRQARSASENDDNESIEYFGGARRNRNVPVAEMVAAIVWVVNVRNKYISKSSAAASATSSGEPVLPTSLEAAHVLDWMQKPQSRPPAIVETLQKNPAVKEQAKKMTPLIVKWMKETDFTKLNSDPTYADYNHNLNMIAHSDAMPPDKIGYVGGAVSAYLREQRRKEAAVVRNNPAAINRGYLGAVKDKIDFKAKFTGQKVFTNPYGTTWLYSFETPEGNLVQWWASKDCQLVEGQSYQIKATIKIADLNRYTQQPTTTITRAKLTPL